MIDISKNDLSRERAILFDIPIDLLDKQALMMRIDDMIKTDGAHYIMPINPIKIVTALRNQEFKRIILGADLIFPDAIGISWALRFLHTVRLKKISGFELMQDILDLASRKHYRVYLLGTRPEAIQNAAAIFSRRYQGAEFVGYHDGFFKTDQMNRVIGLIKSAKPQILLVGMGVYRQEKFIVEVSKHLNIPLSMGVGGSFDVVAGTAPRAPQWLCDVGLEWLYRLFRQPKRIRPMIALPRFIFFVLQEKMQRR